MSSWILEEKGFGRYKGYSKKPKRISDRMARKLKEEGMTVYDSKKEAEEHC